MIYVLGGGGQGKGPIKKGTIVVTYPAGATCTVTNGSQTYTALDTSGAAAFIVEPGTWTVKATKGSDSNSKSVTVAAGGWISVELSFWDGTIYNAGTKVKQLYSNGVGTTHTTTWNAANVTLKATLNSSGSRGCGELIYSEPLILSEFSTLSAVFSGASASVRGDAWVMAFVSTETTPAPDGPSYTYDTVSGVVASSKQSIKNTASGTLTVDISALTKGTSYTVGVALICDSNNWSSQTTGTVNVSKLICS